MNGELPKHVITFLQYGAFGLLALIVVGGMWFGARLLDRIGLGIVAAMKDTTSSITGLKTEVGELRREVNAAVAKEGSDTREKVIAAVRDSHDDLVGEIRDVGLEPTNPGIGPPTPPPYRQPAIRTPREREVRETVRFEGDDPGRRRRGG